MKKLDKPIYIKLGKQLKQARLNKGYSLAEVAEKVGKSKVSIKRYEDASVRIDMDTLKKISDVLGMQVMDSTAEYNGEIIERVINLYPKFEDMIQYDEEPGAGAENMGTGTGAKIYVADWLQMCLKRPI